MVWLQDEKRYEGYAHDHSESVLRCGWHFLAGCANLLDGAVQVVQIRGDVPLIHWEQIEQDRAI